MSAPGFLKSPSRLTIGYKKLLVDSVALNAELWTFLNSSDCQRTVQEVLKGAMCAQGILATYLHSRAGANLLAENILHWFAQHNFLRELLCVALKNHRILSIFAPMVSNVLQQQILPDTKEQIESMMPPSPGVRVENPLS